MKKLGVIPARYNSTRFEGKPLAIINGHTMIEWVYKRTLKSNLDEVIVATDDKRIYDEVIRFGGKVMLTSKKHETGTDRIVEVAKQYTDFDIIINIQGDEPLIETSIINELANAFEEDKIDMASVKYKIEDKNEIENPNAVKVVTDKNNFAMYFSRSPIPYPRKKENIEYYKHIGIYGYRREFLLKYSEMEITKLERNESLEQLRALENGYKIKMIETKHKVWGVDTPEDLHNVEAIISERNIEI